MLYKLILKHWILRYLAGETAVLLNRFGLLPNFYQNLASRWQGSRCFRKGKLNWSSNGYWELDPMPDETELMELYRTTFQPMESWSFKEKSIAADLRDFDHVNLLKQTYPHELKGIRFLNFGAGLGGASYILKLLGARVTNIEPFHLPSFDWEHYPNLSFAEGKFDVIYSSHSLEHVTDVQTTMTRFDQLLKKGSYLFIEVPNCRQSNCTDPQNGGQDGMVRTPHTIYFTMDFFKTLPYQEILLSTFEGGIGEQDIPSVTSHEDGNVIRYIGRKN